MRSPTLLLGALGLTLASTELAHALAASPTPQPATKPVILMLGFHSRRNGAPHPVQRWRIKLALRTAQRYHSDRMIISGGFTRGPRSEAGLLAELLSREPNPFVEIRLEERATTTWENVMFSRALLGGDETVVIVSDPLHAARARRYWLKQSPGDQHRVFITGCCGLFDGWWLKSPTAIVEILRWVKVRYFNAPISDPTLPHPTLPHPTLP